LGRNASGVFASFSIVSGVKYGEKARRISRLRLALFLRLNGHMNLPSDE
jgi:hypothetical protein